MDVFKKSFQEGEKEGRYDARKTIKSMREGGSPLDDYFFKLTNNTIVFSIIVGVIAFIFFLIDHIRFFSSILFAFGIYVLTLIVMMIANVDLLKLPPKGSVKTTAGTYYLTSCRAQLQVHQLA